MADNWRRYYRLAHRAHQLEARRTKGGEPYGYKALRVAPAGQWLCRALDSGHTWVCCDADFEGLYCEVGKSPPKKRQKKQSEGRKRGKSQGSLSSEVQSVSIPGGLFEDNDG